MELNLEGYLEGILTPLDQDLILITAFKIKNKIRNRIGVREPELIEAEQSIHSRNSFVDPEYREKEKRGAGQGRLEREKSSSYSPERQNERSVSIRP